MKRWISSDGDPTHATPTATYFYYDGWNLIQETGLTARTYVHGAWVDEIVASAPSTGGWLYHYYDARGNCIMLTDASGGIQELYEYDAFGQPYIYTGNGNLVARKFGSPAGNRFLFTGREWLKDMRVYDFRARLYQPELGRFLQPDLKQFEAGDYNLYRYCHNDPVNKSDPTGLQDEVTNKPNLTITGQGDWMRAGSAFTNGDRLSAAKNYVGEIKSAVQKSLNEANKNSPFVRWSATVNNLQKSADYFQSPSTTASTELGTTSTAVKDAGSVASFNINLQININWNESKSASFGLALRTDNTHPLGKTGEIEHPRDAAFALNHKYGGSRSAVAIANEQASSMVGYDMSAGEASMRMDFALKPWVDAWKAETKKRDYSGEHTY